MYIPNDDKQNHYLCKVQLVVISFNKPTNKNLIKVPKVVEPMNMKTLLKTLGTGVIKRLMFSPPLGYNCDIF